MEPVLGVYFTLVLFQFLPDSLAFLEDPELQQRVLNTKKPFPKERYWLDISLLLRSLVFDQNGVVFLAVAPPVITVPTFQPLLWLFASHFQSKFMELILV